MVERISGDLLVLLLLCSCFGSKSLGLHAAPAEALVPVAPGARQRPMAGEQRQESGCVPLGNCCVAVPQDRIYAVEVFGSFTSQRRAV